MTIDPSAHALAARIPNGASIAIAKEPLEPVALVRAIMAARLRDLHLINIPTGQYITDVLVGSGCIATLETSGVSLGEYGPAPQFNKAVRSGAIKILDATCPAVFAALQAGEKGNPYMPMRGLIGSDILANRPDWKVENNPFSDQDDPIVLLKAIRPDFALMHVPLADRFGNLWVGMRTDLTTMAHAAHATLATAEVIVDTNLEDDPVLAPNLISGLYVDAIAHVPRGAWPTACPKPQGGFHYPKDTAHIAEYAGIARDQSAYEAYISAPLEAAE